MKIVFRILGPLMGALFLGLTLWTRRLPVLRGSMWTLKDTLVRAGAVVAGVLFVLWILASLLPVLLNRLEGRHWDVLQQDRAMLGGCEAGLERHEHLYGHDVGVVSLRRHLNREARAQLTALQRAGVR